MDDPSRRRYIIQQRDVSILNIQVRLSKFPGDISNTIACRTSQDLQRKYFDKCTVKVIKLKAGDALISVTRRESSLNFLDVLTSLDRIIFEIPLPTILYACRNELDYLIDKVERDTNVTCKLVTYNDIVLITAGRTKDVILAKQKLLVGVLNLMNKENWVYEGYVSSEYLIKNKIGIYFLSKIDCIGALLTGTNEILNEIILMSERIIEYPMIIDIFKLTYLIYFQRMTIERILSEEDCYLTNVGSINEYRGKIIIKGFDYYKVRRCCRKLQSLIQDVIKAVSVEMEPPIEAREVFVFEFGDVYETDFNLISDQEDLCSEERNDLTSETFNEKIFKSINIEKKKGDCNWSRFVDIPQPFDIKALTSCLRHNQWLINKSQERSPTSCNKHHNENTCDCLCESKRYAKYIQENQKYIYIGLRGEIKRMFQTSDLVYEIENEIDPDLEDFLCGKKNGKINKICKENKSEVFICSRSENLEKKILIFISGRGRDIYSTVNALEDEFPAELSFNLDEKHHRRIIGYGGKNIQKIMKKHGVYIKFMGNEEKLKLGFTGNVVIKTPRRNEQGLLKMKCDVLALAEEPDMDEQTPEQIISLFLYYELFLQNVILKFDHAICFDNESYKTYFIESGKIFDLADDEFISKIENKLFLFTKREMDFDVIDNMNWAGRNDLSSRLFETVLLYTYEPTLKGDGDLGFYEKVSKPVEASEDIFTVGKGRRDGDKQCK